MIWFLLALVALVCIGAYMDANAGRVDDGDFDFETWRLDRFTVYDVYVVVRPLRIWDVKTANVTFKQHKISEDALVMYRKKKYSTEYEVVATWYRHSNFSDDYNKVAIETLPVYTPKVSGGDVHGQLVPL